MSIRSSITEPHLMKWAPGNLKSGLQTDSSSCGSFLAMVIFVIIQILTLCDMRYKYDLGQCSLVHVCLSV